MDEFKADGCLMFLVLCLTITLITVSLLIIIDLGLAWRRLITHPHIEAIEVAEPSIADALKQLVAEVSATAGVLAPALYIRRAALPNAFIVATIFRPELYLTDEMLEQCDNSLEDLTRVICHEIAHIQRGDAFRLGLLNYGILWSGKLTLKRLEGKFRSTINSIERQTDTQAEVIFQQLIPR
ncbi:MAG: M48 family metalloprotease [Mariprofundaceae bacterium]